MAFAEVFFGRHRSHGAVRGLAAAPAPSGTVSVSGALTIFQSALSPYLVEGNRSLDGVARWASIRPCRA